MMGIEKGMFAALTLLIAFAFVARAIWLGPVIVVLFFVARWLSKVDDQYVAILLRYLNEEHVYDATPRPSDFTRRPKGWGRGIPR